MGRTVGFGTRRRREQQLDGLDRPDVEAALTRPTLPATTLPDGLVGACKASPPRTGGLPATGGLRPQVMATIDYRDRSAWSQCWRHIEPAAGTLNQRHRHLHVHRARHRLHHPQTRLRRRHHPGRHWPGSRASFGHRPSLGSSRRHVSQASPPGTKAAPSRNAPFRPRGAKPTTSPTGPAAAPPERTTGPCCAPITTT